MQIDVYAVLQRVRNLIGTKETLTSTFGRWNLERSDLIWALGSLCAIHRIPFDVQLLLRQFTPPYTTDTLIHAARELGFKIKLTRNTPENLIDVTTPCLAMMKPAKNIDDSDIEDTQEPANPDNEDSDSDQQESVQLPDGGLAILSDIDPNRVVLFESNTNTPKEVGVEEFAERYFGSVFLIAKKPEEARDPDAVGAEKEFGFSWFVPELLKHRSVWRDVLLASLVIQLLALGVPLFTQAIIDKVIVHRTESTLVVIAFGMAVFMVFSTLLTWIRQYLVLHTGNRVDAVLASEVFTHLFKSIARRV